MTKLEN